MKFPHLLLLGGLLPVFATAIQAATVFTGGLADLTFFYDSANDRHDVVFRTKANTEASGLGPAYGAPPGGVGGDVANDRTFDSLRIVVSAAPVVTLNGIGYLVTPASGSSLYTDPSQPDLGIRTRLRENAINPGDPVVQQFANLRLSLDWAASLKPSDSAAFALFNTTAFGEVGTVLYDTAAEDFTHDWGNYGHTHWHFGFSEAGDYSLVFAIDGVGGAYGDDDTPGTVTLQFTVIPEPATAGMALFAAGLLGLRRRR